MKRSSYPAKSQSFPPPRLKVPDAVLKDFALAI